MYPHGPPGPSVFEVLREEIPLQNLIETNGRRTALCVAHDEREPSMHLYDDHAHCFGCGFHGDVVDVWAAKRGFDRPVEAAFNLAREFNVRLPEMGEEAREQAVERRKKEQDLFEAAKQRHVALIDHARVRKWWIDRGFDADTCGRFLLGTDEVGTAATIPFWTRGGRVAGIIHRKLEGEPKYRLPSAEELPEGHRPLFIPAPIKGETFLVEGFIDALAVAASSAGRSVVAVGGTVLSDLQGEELRRVLPADAQLYILPDADESGAEAARGWSRGLFPKARVCPPDYGRSEAIGDHNDFADFFAASGRGEEAGEHLSRVVAASKDAIDIEVEVAAGLEGGPRERLAYATDHIVPLLARIKPSGMQDATADIVSEQVRGLKKSWLNKAVKEEAERQEAQMLAALNRQIQEEREQRLEEYRQRVADAQDEIDPLFEPGVLERLRNLAAKMHNVYGDEEPLDLAILVALGAQLEPLPNGRPLGASILLTASAGRGKNHIVDAAVKPLPPEFYFAFEIASGQSLYYKADEDPDFLKHTFAYPNEIEGAEALWEFLRPMLSKGWARKIVTAKDAFGNMTTRTIIVEGPVTIAIPTIRNKTDEQLHTRLLIAELPDYVGRVKKHSRAVSEQLLPDAAAADYSREQWLWQEGLRQLTATRRVIFPLKHPDFALDDDQVSHGARLWANLLSLMATNAWLEQKSRRLLNLSREGDDEPVVAIEATPDDYEVAHRVFSKVCRRTVVNLSDTHRKILDVLYMLEQEDSEKWGFSQREISTAAKVSQSVVSENKTFLVTSAKIVRETEHGLSLVKGAEPSWWAEGNLMQGLPSPEQVRAWWEEIFPDPPEPPDHADHPDQNGQNPRTYAERVIGTLPISRRSPKPLGRGTALAPTVIGR